MKKIVTITTICTAFVLSGCATGNVPLSDTEKTQVKSGQLVKFTSIYTNASKEKMRRGKSVYVCAVSTNIPTDATPCYPKLSAYLGKYFTDAGVNVVASKYQADEIVYMTLVYHYLGSTVYYGASGDGYRSMIDDTLEWELQKSDGEPQLTEADMKAAFAQNPVAKKEVASHAALETAGKIFVGLAAMAIGGVNGGPQASQALTGIANPASINAPNGTQGAKDMLIFLHEKSLNNDVSKGPIMSFTGFYQGPRDMFQAFPALFPSAMKNVAKSFVDNTEPLAL